MSLMQPVPKTCRCPCCNRLFHAVVTSVSVLNEARRRFDWPALLCTDCLGEPQRVQGQACPHVATANPERAAR